jgi:O-methyltransferase involved in polyketide biosynthesis
MSISQVSRTAILTLIARVVASHKQNTVYNDPMAVLVLERLIPLVSEEDRRWIVREQRVFNGMQAHHAIAGAWRAQVFDQAAQRFIASHPGCAIINLGCGFDTRFWRIPIKKCRFIEIDLPDVIALKREILKDQPGYEMIGCSVLDEAWIEQVTAQGNSDFLLLAEGLFPYLPKPDALRLFQRLSQRFTRSQLILDIVPENFTKGIVKMLVGLETKISWGLDIEWAFGIRDPRDMEGYAPGLKLLEHVKASGGPIMTVAINAA